MDTLSFDIIAKAWKKLINDPDKLDSIQTQAPGLTQPGAIRLKNVEEMSDKMHIRFYGFDAASDEVQGVPVIKRMVLNWIKQFADFVQVMDSGDSDLNLMISRRMKFNEAAVPVFRRDPKTNKVKRAYKCIGGKKDGRRVSDPDQCLQYPSVAKKISLSISKRAKYGQRSKARTKTKLTNIVSRRVRKANQRLKKARGF